MSSHHESMLALLNKVAPDADFSYHPTQSIEQLVDLATGGEDSHSEVDHLTPLVATHGNPLNLLERTEQEYNEPYAVSTTVINCPVSILPMDVKGTAHVDRQYRTKYHDYLTGALNGTLLHYNCR